jgi:fumarate reductase subunit D
MKSKRDNLVVFWALFIGGTALIIPLQVLIVNLLKMVE